MLDWQKFFRVLNKEAEGVEDIINGLEFIKNNYDWGNDGANVGGMVGDYNPSWIIEEEARYREQRGSESEKTEQIKRSIVCGHPLEWDKELYLEGGSIRPGIATSYGTWLSRGDQEYFKEKVEAIDIWEGLKGKTIQGLDTSKNNFWFAHPIYFINHLKKAGLLEREMLIRVQDIVIKLECLKRGARGIYNKNANIDQTYCNQAIYLTIKAVDKNFRNFTGRNDNGFPDYEPEPVEYTKKTGLRPSNYWCDVMKKQSETSDSTGIVHITGEEAQSFADMGYVVVGAWKNEKKGDNSPHFATVRPGGLYNDKDGPMVANVGWDNDILPAKDAFRGDGNRKTKFEEICWYYNKKQSFTASLDYLKEILRYK